MSYGWMFLVSPQSTVYFTRDGRLLSWSEYMLPRIARRYRVLNRNVWWNRPPNVRIEAENDAEAVDALLALAARRIVEES